MFSLPLWIMRYFHWSFDVIVSFYNFINHTVLKYHSHITAEKNSSSLSSNMQKYLNRKQHFRSGTLNKKTYTITFINRIYKRKNIQNFTTDHQIKKFEKHEIIPHKCSELLIMNKTFIRTPKKHKTDGAVYVDVFVMR